MSSFEIEIKSLLGSDEKVREVKKKLLALRPATTLLSHHKQLNHYFVGGDLKKALATLAPHLSQKKQDEFALIVKNGSDFSVRTRLMDDAKLLFVVKASLDEGTSHNTVSRAECEAELKGMSLQKLDQRLLDAGFSYQAKWSREREEYESGNIIVCFDKNAGYGHLAEFEKVVDDESKVSSARRELQVFMDELGVEELKQDRLERMFAHYNEHWRDYYGTDKIFVIH